MTLQISAGAFVVGLAIGLVVACLKLGAPKPIAAVARVYTTLFRAVPELVADSAPCTTSGPCCSIR